MQCPSCTWTLEPTARFCGVCGYQLGAGPTKPTAVVRGPAIKRSAPQPKPPDPYLDRVLNDRFRVESKIGEGGFGAVYRGVQLTTGREVALKLLHPEFAKVPEVVARFRREGAVLCKLRDAHTVTTYDVDQTPDGTLYIAMELLDGKSLHRVFHEQAPLDWKRVFKILTEICSSLAEAHQLGIVHRDLKPENIFLEHRPGHSDYVKVLDFGIAKVLTRDAREVPSRQGQVVTGTGVILGTAGYMSPEQHACKPLDGRSDIYALGAIAYETITGRLPFADVSGPMLMAAQRTRTPAPPSQVSTSVDLPPAADRLILKCLAPDRDKRYVDMSQLSVALRDAMAAP